MEVERCLRIKTKKEGPVPERWEFDSDLKVLISRAIESHLCCDDFATDPTLFVTFFSPISQVRR